MDNLIEDDDVEDEIEEEEEECLDPNNPDHAFAILERGFNKTITEIEENPNASIFAEEFYKIFDHLYRLNEKEKSTRQECEVLRDEIENKDSRLEVALKLVETDRTTINDLKAQLEHTWKLADAAHAREQIAQEIIDNLRKQIEGLNAEIEFKNKMSQQETDEESATAAKQKEGLQRERDRLIGEVAQLTQKLTNALGYQEELEKKNSVADMKILEITGQLEDHAGEIERLKYNREKLQTDIIELNSKLEEKDTTISNMNNIITANQKQMNRLEKNLIEQKLIRDANVRDIEILETKNLKLQDEFNLNQYNFNELKKNYADKLNELKMAKDAVNHEKNELLKLNKLKASLDKKMQALDNEKGDLITERNRLRDRIGLFEKEMDDYKKQNENDKRTIENMGREKDVIYKNLTRQENIVKDQTKMIQIQERGKKKLESELDHLFMENGKNQKIISGLEREKERLTDEQLNLLKKIDDANDDIRLKKTEIYELTKTISENETKLRMQQNMFDTVRTERNTLQKALTEQTAESGELKKILKLSNHQVEQLKEDISAREQLLIKEENLYKKLMKEKENLKVDLNAANEQIKSLKADLAEMETEIKSLNKVIAANERQIKDQTNDIEQLMNERDIFGSQLVRRNDEISLLHEKIRILQTTLQRGESQYGQRIQDIRLLKLEIKRLRQEKHLLSKSLQNSTDLKQEVFHLERDLTKCRLKCKALEEEMQNPLNIHRWRKLEGSDPDVIELLQKIKLLQKRILKQSHEAIDRERQLKETQRLYANIKKVLEKQPSPALKEELAKTQKALKARGDKLKCLVSELNVSELQASEYRNDLEKITNELNEYKKKYLSEKKMRQMEKRGNADSRFSGEPNQNLLSTSEQAIRYVGGGYRMSVPEIKQK